MSDPALIGDGGYLGKHSTKGQTYIKTLKMPGVKDEEAWRNGLSSPLVMKRQGWQPKAWRLEPKLWR
jgi:hypothetical protein